MASIYVHRITTWYNFWVAIVIDHAMIHDAGSEHER